MKFIADLHIHSRFSRATSRDLDLENLYISAQCKGIQVLGTGDATHPGWFDEIQSRLVEAEAGFYRLDPNQASICDRWVPESCRGEVRFVLTAEISNIYKKDGRTRKNHNLVFLPDLETAQRFNRRLEKIGNIHSDGRPILGLDARDLLDIVLNLDARAFLVPAHIWTPWFSMLGSRSGFDSLEQCFGDLAPHVFAAETGLSSDPEMNRRVSGLDRLVLISNSDAHSTAKLGREANCFDTDFSYEGIREALAHPENGGFCGTLEFYPEEGKYHLDGHRQCAVRLTPAETRKLEGICPVCHRPLTLGVLHRVESLADRCQGQPRPGLPFSKLVPLTDILAEVLQCGAVSKRVTEAYRRCLESLGSELSILQEISPDRISSLDIPLLDEAIRRVRQGRLVIDGGFDGQFGTLHFFTPAERRRLLGQQSLFVLPGSPAPVSGRGGPVRSEPIQTSWRDPSPAAPSAANSAGSLMTDAQKAAVEAMKGPVMVVAGPGTGKTFTLTRRIVRLLETGQASAGQILAVTFTQKAADQMQRRIADLMGKGRDLPLIGTLHGCCYRLLQQIDGDRPMTVLDEDHRLELIRDAMTLAAQDDLSAPFSVPQMLGWIEAVKQRIQEPSSGGPPAHDVPARRFYLRVFEIYRNLMAVQGFLDFDDLVACMVVRLEADAELAASLKRRFVHVLVDEYQDLNHAQYRLVRALTEPGSHLFIIGDPDQCIYGFRGSDWRYFDRFSDDYPGASVIRLQHSYRSPQSILDAAGQVVAGCRDGRRRLPLKATAPGRRLNLIRTESEKAEAVAIGRIIEQMVGGSGFEAYDFGKVDSAGRGQERSFADFAILYRTHRQGGMIAEVLEAAGIPCRLASRRRIWDTPHVAGLVCWLRLCMGQGSFFDLERAIAWIAAETSGSDLKRFKKWCHARGYGLAEGMRQAARLPVQGLNAARQHRMIALFADLERIGDEIRDRPLEARIDALLEKTRLGEAFDASPAEAGLAALAEWIDACRDETDLLLHLSLSADADLYDPRGERVALMTLHAAKGLEFPVVFIAGCEDGLIPLIGAEDLDEERRLFYVGLTRAGERLFLLTAARRMCYGRCENRTMSPFIADIDPGLLEIESVAGRPLPLRRQTQMSLF